MEAVHLLLSGDVSRMGDDVSGIGGVDDGAAGDGMGMRCGEKEKVMGKSVKKTEAVARGADGGADTVARGAGGGLPGAVAGAYAADDGAYAGAQGARTGLPCAARGAGNGADTVARGAGGGLLAGAGRKFWACALAVTLAAGMCPLGGAGVERAEAAQGPGLAAGVPAQRAEAAAGSGLEVAPQGKIKVAAKDIKVTGKGGGELRTKLWSTPALSLRNMDVTVKVHGEELERGRDYQLYIESAVRYGYFKPGTYKCKVELRGAYSGVKRHVKFQVYSKGYGVWKMAPVKATKYKTETRLVSVDKSAYEKAKAHEKAAGIDEQVSIVCAGCGKRCGSFKELYKHANTHTESVPGKDGVYRTTRTCLKAGYRVEATVPVIGKDGLGTGGFEKKTYRPDKSKAKYKKAKVAYTVTDRWAYQWTMPNGSSASPFWRWYAELIEKGKIKDAGFVKKFNAYWSPAVKS